MKQLLNKKLAISLLSTSLLCFNLADATTKRTSKARRDFIKTHPCPSTNKTKAPCPGYIVDHIIPLACNAPDNPSNMQWQTVKAAKAKDKWERKSCKVK